LRLAVGVEEPGQEILGLAGRLAAAKGTKITL
jgi:hypothetical protein